MRVRMLAAVVAFMFLVGCGTVIGDLHVKEYDRTAYAPLALEGTEFTKVAENDSLELLINPETTEAAVRQKATGLTWYTNPQGRANDAIAQGSNAEELSSQFVIHYADKANHISNVNSCNMSVANGQFSYFKLDNGIKVDYLLQQKQETTYMPQACTEEDYKNIVLKRLPNRKERAALADAYNKVTMSEESADRRADIIAKFPEAAKQKVIYMLFSSIKAAGLKRISDVFQSVGFTLEEKSAMEAKLGMVKADTDKWFTVSIEYTLDGDNLVVNVPGSDIRTSNSYIITDILMMPFFGAGTSSDDGYLFVPDGCGAVADFKDNAQFNSEVVLNYYGTDNSLNILSRTVQMQNLYLPVYGIKVGDQAFLGILEDGAPLASLQVNKAGRINDYNSLGLIYEIHESALIDLQGLNNVNAVRMYQKKGYSGNFTIRYAFMSGEAASYSGMAACYRSYLQKKGLLKQSDVQDKYPFYLDLLCAVNKEVPRLGIPINTEIGMTTFAQADDILGKLSGLGVKDFVLKLSGWNAGGVNSHIPGDVDPSRAVGGKAGMDRLLALCTQRNAKVYFDWDGSYLNLIRDSIFDSFNPARNASKAVTQKIAYKNSYWISTGDMSGFDSWYLYNPEFKKRLAESFISSLSRNKGIKGVALTWEGHDLNSDFNKNNQYDREKSMENDEAVMSGFADKISLMATGTNSYALPYVSFVEGLPSSSSRLDFYTYDVPFYQMAVHGSIPYSMEYMNQNQSDMKVQLLKLIETGSLPSWLWVYDDSSDLKDSSFSDLYSLNYKIWMNEAVRIYAEARSVLEPLLDVPMTEHKQLMQNVYKVTYANKTSIYVNYNSSDVTVDSIVVPAYSYKVIK